MRSLCFHANVLASLFNSSIIADGFITGYVENRKRNTVPEKTPLTSDSETTFTYFNCLKDVRVGYNFHKISLMVDRIGSAFSNEPLFLKMNRVLHSLRAICSA